MSHAKVTVTVKLDTSKILAGAVRETIKTDIIPSVTYDEFSVHAPDVGPQYVSDEFAANPIKKWDATIEAAPDSGSTVIMKKSA